MWRRLMELWRRKEIHINLIVALATIIFSLIAAGLVNILTAQMRPSLLIVLALLVVVIVGWASINIYSSLRTEAEFVSSTPEREQENRKRLIERVRDKWIKGALENSLYHQAGIELGLSEYPDALADPFHLSLWEQDHLREKLQAGTRIIDVYDKAKRELLILGEPGSGKSTLLLELTRTLLQRATRDEKHPLPVVFNLSSWAIERLPLTHWLVEELYLKYQVPRSLGQFLVNNEQILPLLDGLDEVAISSRTACIETINTYRRDHGITPTVVCCRTVDYFAQTARLQLQYSVEVNPLEEQQVDDYLSTLGDPAIAIQKALRDDAGLRELVSTPLMLSILILAYQGQPVETSILTGSQE